MSDSRGVSLIIPTFNRHDMLRKSLECLKARTQYLPKEIILVDDGSEPEHIPHYEPLKIEGLVDKIVLLPHKNYARLTDAAYLAGLQHTNPEYPYIFFGTDDLLYRTGWIQVLIDMLESPWAKKYNVQIASGFSHWAASNDTATMKKIVDEMYQSADGKVQGYVAEWGGNYFMRRSFFNEMGGFVNNLKTLTVPPQYASSYEAVLQYKGLEMGWKWANTLETYVQTMALPGSSTLGNYRIIDGQLANNERYRNGIAIGILWKDE